MCRVIEHFLIKRTAEGEICGIVPVFDIAFVNFAGGDAEEKIDDQRDEGDGNHGDAEDSQNGHR